MKNKYASSNFGIWLLLVITLSMKHIFQKAICSIQRKKTSKLEEKFYLSVWTTKTAQKSHKKITKQSRFAKFYCNVTM